MIQNIKKGHKEPITNLLKLKSSGSSPYNKLDHVCILKLQESFDVVVNDYCKNKGLHKNYWIKIVIQRIKDI